MSELIGRFAFSKAGHDKDILYVVIAQENKYIYLSDGKYHPLDKPKKKSLKHVGLHQTYVTKELQERIIKKEKVFDHEIKYAIKMQGKGKEEEHV